MKGKMIVFMCLALLQGACRKRDMFCRKGNGEVVSKELTMAPFDRIQVNGSMEVYIKEGERQQVRIEAESNLWEALNKQVANGTWQIEFQPCASERKTIRIYATVPRLKEVQLNGSGLVKGQNAFHSEQVGMHVNGSGKIDMEVYSALVESSIMGSGKIILRGSAAELHTHLNGSGHYLLFGIGTRKALVQTHGSGSTELSVTDILIVVLSGSGKVYYKGTPALRTSRSGAGEVIKKG